MGPPPAIAPARPQELETAFRLIFRHVADTERDTRVANALHLVRQGELDPAGILVASVDGAAVGALACLPVPGASGLLWPPQAIEGPAQAAVEDALVGRASAWLRERGAKLAQCLLSEEETGLAGPLLRNGFAHVTALCYMQHDLAESPPLRDGGRLRCVPYSHLLNRAAFHQTLLRTYERTEDCPEITGVRSADEIIAGHRAQGKHNPGRWWLALAGGAAARRAAVVRGAGVGGVGRGLRRRGAGGARRRLRPRTDAQGAVGGAGGRSGAADAVGGRAQPPGVEAVHGPGFQAAGAPRGVPGDLALMGRPQRRLATVCRAGPDRRGPLRHRPRALPQDHRDDGVAAGHSPDSRQRQ